VRHKPGVLPRVPFLEPGLLRRVEGRQPRSVAQPRPDPTGFRIEEVPPVPAARECSRRARAVARTGSDQRQREIGDAVLQGRARAAAELVHGQIPETRQHFGTAPHEIPHRRVQHVGSDETATHAIGDHRHRRVAAHVGSIEVVLAPTRELSRLSERGEQRQQHVAVTRRLKRRKQLVLGLVRVPQREVGVVHPISGDVDLAVHSEVAAVDVHLDVGVLEGVIHRGVERLPLRV
jgi:hypothetical protein